MFCFVCFWSKARIEGNRSFLFGFKMVPSLTCTVEPEAGDARIGGLRKRLALAKVGAGKRAMWDHLGMGVPAKGAGTKRATDLTSEAGGEGGKGRAWGDVSATSEKLSRYLEGSLSCPDVRAFMKCHVKRTDVQLANGDTPVNTREANAWRENPGINHQPPSLDIYFLL